VFLKKELIIISEHTSGRGRTPYPTPYSHLQGSICVLFSSNIIIPVSPHVSHVCAYIADSIYLPTLMLWMLAVNFFTLPNSLAFSDAIRWSTALISVATLSIDSNLEPCQIEYVIVIISFLLSVIGEHCLGGEHC
jgi:hypothetical protein